MKTILLVERVVLRVTIALVALVVPLAPVWFDAQDAPGLRNFFRKRKNTGHADLESIRPYMRVRLSTVFQLAALRAWVGAVT
jgi:hypothetical protein